MSLFTKDIGPEAVLVKCRRVCIDTLIWEIVRDGRLGFEFYRDVGIGPHRLAFYCPEAMLGLVQGEEASIDFRLAPVVREGYLLTLGVALFRIPPATVFATEADDWERQLVKLLEHRCERMAFPS